MCESENHRKKFMVIYTILYETKYHLRFWISIYFDKTQLQSIPGGGGMWFFFLFVCF